MYRILVGEFFVRLHKMTKGTKNRIPWQILNHYTIGLLADICHFCCYNHHEHLGYCIKSYVDLCLHSLMCCVDKVHEMNTKYKTGQDTSVKFEVYHTAKVGNM